LAASQEARPEVTSVAVKEIATGALYQPAAFAARAAEADAAGGVPSYLSVSEADAALPAPSRQEPPRDVEAVSGPA
jgi:hypothetical protein